MKKGMPHAGELVVCRITRLYPNSASALLVEYNKPGMIHVSEVASRWVRDIREFLRENQYVVCRVLGVEGQAISLSMKKARREDTVKKMNEYKRETKAEAMLEQIGKGMGKSLEQAYQDVGFLLQEEFGSLTKAFEVALKNPDLLAQKGVPPSWGKALQEAAHKRFGEKTYEVKGELELFSYRPDGVELLKAVLLSARKKGLEVSYLSAPRYLLSAKGGDYKKLRASLEEAGQELAREMQKRGGEGKFALKG